MKRLLSSLIKLFFALNIINAQVSQIIIEKNFNSLPFKELIHYIEANYNLQFFYLDKWTDSLKVVQSATPSSLEQILKESFKRTKLEYFVDNQENIIITYQYRIDTGLLALLENEDVKREQERNILDESSFFRKEPSKPVETTTKDKIITIGIPGDVSRTSKATISGIIREKETGQPILGATVFVSDLNLGTITDSYGYYVISISPGNHEFVIKYLGRKDQSAKVLVNGNGSLDFLMEEKLIELRGVIITADKEQNVRGLQLGLDKLDIQTMKLIPSIGETDIIKSTLLLPGVKTVGEGASGFNVRGGSTDQNLILMDGSPLFNSSHLFGFFSVFNQDVVKDFKLYKSGIPAQYGGRLSSVLDVSIKSGNQKKLSFSGGISPISMRLNLEGPIIKDKLTFLISSRGSYSDWVLRRTSIPTFKNSLASFLDLNTKIDYEINKNNQLSISAYYSEDHFKLNSDTLYNYYNINSSINLKHTFSKKLYSLFSGIYSNYEYSVGSKKRIPYAFDLNYFINYLEARTDFTWFLNADHKLNFGANMINYRINPGTINPVGPESLILSRKMPGEQAVETSIYASDEYNITENIAINYGLRYSGFLTLGPGLVYKYQSDVPKSLLNRTDSVNYPKNKITNQTGGPEIRFSARYKTGPASSIKFSYTKMFQYLHMLSNTTAVSPTDIWKVSGPNLPAQKSIQYSAGFYKDLISNTIEASLEVYYKTSKDILEYRGGTDLLLNPNLEVDLLRGIGKAYGTEVLFKKKHGALNGWVSYTYSRSLIKVDSKYAVDQINQGDYYPANYDKPHDFTLVANYRISRIHSFSSTVTYSTGRPITYPVGKYRYRERELINYSNRNEYRIPDYFRWDISVNIEGNLKKKKANRDSISLSVYNITGRDNVYSVFFVSSENRRVKGYKLSVFSVPIISVTYNFRF